MDPITLAITTALGNLGQSVIKDAYDALKAALQKKFGADSDLVDAVDKFEQKPESKARETLLQEEVDTTKAMEDTELIQLAESLIEKIKELPDEPVKIKQKVEINGNRNIVAGRDVTINE